MTRILINHVPAGVYPTRSEALNLVHYLRHMNQLHGVAHVITLEVV